MIPPGGFGTQDYSGERNEKAVYAWTLKFFSHFVEKVNSENVDAFLNKVPKPRLFPPAFPSSPPLHSLSPRLLDACMRKSVPKTSG